MVEMSTDYREILQTIKREFLSEYPELKEIWTIEELDFIIELYYELADLQFLEGKISRESFEELSRELEKFDWPKGSEEKLEDRPYWLWVLRSLRHELRLKEGRKIRYQNRKEEIKEFKEIKKQLAKLS